jgi:aconitate hydratase
VLVIEAPAEPVYQVVVGSSANPGLRDFAILAAIAEGRRAHPQVSMDVSATSRQIRADLTAMGGTLSLIKAGARIHQAGCMGCIAMGQAPAIGQPASISRTTSAAFLLSRTRTRVLVKAGRRWRR